MTSIHITGATGYLASNLFQYLSRKYFVSGSSRAALDDFKVINFNDIDSICHSISGSDIVIHAAGPPSAECNTDTLNVRSQHICNLISACKICKVSRVIYLSSIHVYRSPLFDFISERTPLTSDLPYALSHLCGETALLKSDISSSIVRLPNIFGGLPSLNHSSDSLLVHSAARSALSSSVFALHSSGKQYINLLPVQLFCYSVDRLINSKSTPKIINLPGSTLTVLSFLELLSDISSNTSFPFCYVINGHTPKSIPQPPLEFVTNYLPQIGYFPQNIDLRQYLTAFFNDISQEN